MDWPSSSLRVRLLLLLLVAAVPGFALSIYNTLEDWRASERAVERDALQAARRFADRQRDLIRATEQLLLSLAKISDYHLSRPSVCSTHLKALVERTDRYSNLGVIDAGGILVCSAAAIAAPINLADRSYFQRAVEKKDFAVGEYQIGRVTGKPTITFAYAITDSNGQVRGVVFAALDLAALNNELAIYDAPEGSSVFIADNQGKILARYPELSGVVGRTMPDNPAVRAILAGGKSTGVIQETGLDGARRIYGFTKLYEPPGGGSVYVSVGTPASIAFAEAKREFIRDLVVISVMLVFLVLAAPLAARMLVLRPVDTLIAGARRIAHGDLAARIGRAGGTAELRQLAGAFDDMAEKLQRREREKDAAEAETRKNLARIWALHEIDLAISATLDLRLTLEVLLEKIRVFIHYDAAAIRLVNERNELLMPGACGGFDRAEWGRAVAESGGSILGKNIDKLGRAPVSGSVDDLEAGPYKAFLRGHGLRSYLAVALLNRNVVVGSLAVYKKDALAFTGDEIDFLDTLGGQAAIAISNARLYDQVNTQRAELEISNRVKDEFLSVMSHELRTPLSVIMGYTAMMREGMVGAVSAQQINLLEKVESRGREQLNIINDIMQTTQLEMRSTIVHKNVVHIPELFQQLRADYGLVAKNNVMIEWNSPLDLPPLITDAGKLKQILQNVINNAIKFTAAGAIEVSAAPAADGRHIEFKVSDTGTGIPDQALPLIFEKFYQADSSETRSYGGVGLGLYIVKRFTEVLGGSVEVQSRPGKGSIFTVRLPYES